MDAATVGPRDTAAPTHPSRVLQRALLFYSSCSFVVLVLVVGTSIGGGVIDAVENAFGFRDERGRSIDASLKVQRVAAEFPARRFVSSRGSGGFGESLTPATEAVDL